MSNWNMHPTMRLTINIRSAMWWVTVRDDVCEWLDTEGIEAKPARGVNPNIYLYSEKQIAYFKLRWPQ